MVNKIHIRNSQDSGLSTWPKSRIFFHKTSWEWYCWWLKSQTTTVWMVLKRLVNNGIHYQPQLVVSPYFRVLSTVWVQLMKKGSVTHAQTGVFTAICKKMVRLRKTRCCDFWTSLGQPETKPFLGWCWNKKSKPHRIDMYVEGRWRCGKRCDTI